MLTAYYAIVACAIVTMVIGLKMVVGLRKMAPGGTIGKAVNWTCRTTLRPWMKG